MKNSKKIVTGSLMAVGVVAMGAVTAFAYQGDPNIKGPNYTPERHAAMTRSFEAQDYNSWKKLVANNKGKVKDLITEENFPKFVEARNAALAGDTEKAKEIRAELGLGLRNGTGQGQGLGKNRGNERQGDCGQRRDFGGNK